MGTRKEPQPGIGNGPAANAGPGLPYDPSGPWAEFGAADPSAGFRPDFHGSEDFSASGAPTFPVAPDTTASAPLAYLLASAAAVLGALGLLIGAAHKPLASLFAWVLAGPVAIICVGLFLGADTRRRAATVYFAKPWSKTAYTVIAIAAVVVATWAGWQFADWAARR